jgi:hypothetical protein
LALAHAAGDIALGLIEQYIAIGGTRVNGLVVEPDVGAFWYRLA